MIINRRITIVICTLSYLLSVKGQSFSELNSTLPNIINSITALGDIDNDGDLDLYLSGSLATSSEIEGGLYMFENGDYTLNTTSNLPLLALGSARFADYNNDGFQDILIQGHNDNTEGVTRLYLNNTDNTFTELEIGLPPMYLGEVAFSDIDNDGDLDISITGIETETWSFITKLYINNGDNTITELNNPEAIPGMNYGRLKWADYNNDNYPDFLLSGYNIAGGDYYVTIYKNNGDNTFSNSNIPLTQNWLGDTEWADYNNDGFIDLVVSGSGGTSGMERSTIIYKNIDGNTFTPLDINLPGVSHSVLEWNDFNLDGLLDLFISGATTTPGEGNYANHVYVNNGDDTFTPTDGNLAVSYYGDGDSGDINNDGKPDIIISGFDENNSPKTTVFINETTTQNIFQPITSIIDDFSYTAIDWGDIDGNGFKDLVISGALDTTGDYNANESAIKIYSNNNGEFTELSTPNIYGLHLGDIKFADIDNDGDLDLLVTGQNYNNITSYFFTIYENNNSNFTVKQELEGVIFASIDTGDYDNDGDLDLLVTGAFQDAGGASALTKLYNNNDGNFSESSVSIPAVQNGKAQFADLDKDMDLDIVIMGNDINYNQILKTFINSNGVFTENQNLTPISDGWFDLGDFDNDGDLDIAIMGYDSNYDYTTKIYSNTNGQFTEHSTLTGLGNFGATKPIAWGDYDNDGDLDLVVSGGDNNYDDFTHLYQNNDGIFTIANEGLTNLGGSASLGWCDINNDNDLDIIVSGFNYDENDEYISASILHENTTSIQNEKPNPPTNLMSQINVDGSITFSWNNATDDYTPANGLHYWLTIGTLENTSDVASYKVYGNSWTIKNLENENYYWTVNAIDTAFVFSDAANNQTLSIENVNNSVSFGIYPNPSKDKKVNLIYDVNTLSSNKNEVSIFSVSGQKVFEAHLNNNIDSNNKSLDLSSLANGIYVLQFTSGNNSIRKKLILK